MGTQFWSGMMEKFWRRIMVRLPNNVNVFNATELYPLKGLKWQIICRFLPQ